MAGLRDVRQRLAIHVKRLPSLESRDEGLAEFAKAGAAVPVNTVVCVDMAGPLALAGADAGSDST